jgi:conjugative transfer region protein TrbK
MDGKTLARIGAVAFVALAIAATAIEMSRKDDQPEASASEQPAITARDPLETELARCSRAGEAGARDPACLTAWAENRRRFLGQPAPASSAPSAPTAPTTLFPSEPAPTDQTAPAGQPAPARPGPSQDEAR